MPLIRIEFDNATVADEDARAVSVAVRDIVSRETSIEDAFVYANSSHIKIQVAPIEIFVEMSAHKIKDIDALVLRIKESLCGWKKTIGFPHRINFTLIPMTWKVETGI
jgi:hypothetical protein